MMRATAEKGDYSVDSLLNWIERYIEENDIQVGDALPTEGEIVEKTQLSRTSVREGLNRLRALGVVETKRKRGMRLTRSVALLDLVRLLGGSELPEELKSHVRGFRSAVELGLGPEIFRCAKPSDVRELRKIYRAMESRSIQADAWLDLDRAFHLQLAKISGNQVAIWFYQLLEPYFRAYPPSSYPVPEETLRRHELIVEALEKKDPYKFDHALREHHLHKLTP